MKFGIIEGFEMHRTKERFGILSDGDRISLLKTIGDLGFHGVEFGISHDYEQDPLWNGKGNAREKIRKAAESMGVETASVCLHMLNDQSNSPASLEAEHRETGKAIVRKTIEACAETGIPVVLVPFFGSGALREDEQKNLVIDVMKELAPVAEKAGVCLGLETSLGAPDMVEIIDAIGSPRVKVYFDTGNADIIGYDLIHEIETLAHRIIQVHMKENPSGILGQGRIDFLEVYRALVSIGFDDYLVLETPAMDNELVSASRNLGYKEGLARALDL